MDSEKDYHITRATSEELDKILGFPFKLLDHGFVRVIDYMGDDNAIVQAARVSYGKGTKKTSADRGLIRYLMRHRHTSPFEMCEIKFHIKAPIFVARQWLRHRMASVNEYSARYSVMNREFYIPDISRVASQSTENHQGSGATLDKEKAQKVLEILRRDSEQCYESYETMLEEDGLGVARELARMDLTLNTYTEFYWKIDLHNFMHFLSLRAEGHSQYEIRVYAEVMLDILKKWLPLTGEAFTDFRMGSFSLSASMINVLRRRLKGETVTQEDSGLSKREWDEMNAVLD